MKKFIFLGFFLAILIVSALTVTVSGVGELTLVNCVSVMPVSSRSRVHRYTPAQLRHYMDIYPMPLLLSLDQLSVCPDLGLVKERTRRGTCGRKKQRQIQVIVAVTPRVEYNMVGTKTAPANSDIFHSTARRNGKVRDQSSDLISVKINKTKCKTSCPTDLKVVCINAQPCRQKVLALYDAVSDKFDITFFMVMTPTWLTWHLRVISQNHSYRKGKEGEG